MRLEYYEASEEVIKPSLELWKPSWRKGSKLNLEGSLESAKKQPEKQLRLRRAYAKAWRCDPARKFGWLWGGATRGSELGVTGSEVGIEKTSLEVGRGCFPLFPVPQQTSQWLGSGTARMGDPPLIQGPAPIPQTSQATAAPSPHKCISH